MLKKIVALFALILFLNTPSLFAQREITYDPYVSVFKRPNLIQPEAAEARDQNQVLARILEQPIRPVGYAMGRTAQWVEDHHMDDKAIWLYDELSARGIYPRFKTPSEGSFGVFGFEGRIGIEKLFQAEQPNISTSAFGGWTPNMHWAGTTVEVGGEYKIEVPDSSLFHEGRARYGRSSSESFYGIGQDTSRGEMSSYQPEELKLDALLGYHLAQEVEGRAAFVFQRMNIGNGNRERVGKIKEHFPEIFVPGINGGDLIGLESSIAHDTRDHKSDPKRGGREGIEFSYFHDVDGSNLQYLKVGGTLSHYFPILTDRRILALRLVAEKNQELGGDQIPFFNMSRLGGIDSSRGSELLRSYRYNRFFEEGLILANVEYRYNIYEYGNFGADAFTLFDVGEVFEELGDFGFDELKFSYGGGLNIKFRRRTFLSLALSRGSEGWGAGAQSNVPF